MTTLEAGIKTTLVADDGVGGANTLLTGGIYAYRDDLKKEGISRQKLAGAFDSNGLLKPCLVIRQRSEFLTGQVADQAAQKVSTAQSVELYFYDDGDTGYGTIDSARSRVYTVLSERQMTGQGHRVLRWQIDLDDLREPDLEYAAVLRSDYRAVRIKG